MVELHYVRPIASRICFLELSRSCLLKTGSETERDKSIAPIIVDKIPKARSRETLPREARNDINRSISFVKISRISAGAREISFENTGIMQPSSE